jgi:type I restriction enzyme S subunit
LDYLAVEAAQKNINIAFLEVYLLTTPTFSEQQKIADFLTAVDGRIGRLIRKRALLDYYKKGVMQQLFTQAIRLKDKVNCEAREGALGCDHGNDFPDWEEKKLGGAYQVGIGRHAIKGQRVILGR